MDGFFKGLQLMLKEKMYCRELENEPEDDFNSTDCFINETEKDFYPKVVPSILLEEFYINNKRTYTKNNK